MKSLKIIIVMLQLVLLLSTVLMYKSRIESYLFYSDKSNKEILLSNKLDPIDSLIQLSKNTEKSISRELKQIIVLELIILFFFIFEMVKYLKKSTKNDNQNSSDIRKR